MTCASCANRIERKLNKLPGVTATVNYATEKARVTRPDGGHAPTSCSRRSRLPGYGASLPTTEPAQDDELRRPRCGAWWSARSSPCPVVLLAMVAGLAVLRVGVGLPGAVDAGRRVGRLALPPRHLDQPAPRRDHDGHPGLDGRAGRVRLVGVRRRWPAPHGHVYLETAAVVTTFLLLGRYLEARSRRRAGRRPARAARARRPRRRRAARRRGGPRCRWSSWSSATCSSYVRGRRWPPTASSRTAPRRSTSRCSPGSRCPSRSAPGDHVVGATVNVGGRLVVRATRVGAETQLAQMARLVEDAQNGKAAVQRLADRVSGVFVPAVIVLAAATLGRLGRRGWGLDGGVHRGRGGADHRLPVRAGTGHADRADGRHRARRPARHPDQGPRGARADASGRHRRARQDRDRHHGADGPDRGDRRGRGGRRRRSCASPLRWRTPPSTRSPGRSRPPSATVPAGHRLRATSRGWAWRAASRGTPWSSAAPRCWPSAACHCRGAPEAEGTVVAVGWDGRARGWLVVADEVKPTSAEAVARLRVAGPAADAADR